VERFALPKVTVEEKRGGWYMLELDLNDGSEKQEAPVFRCPKCLTLSALRLHSISLAGEVDASVLCSCGWHQYVILQDWPPTMRKPKQQLHAEAIAA